MHTTLARRIERLTALAEFLPTSAVDCLSETVMIAEHLTTTFFQESHTTMATYQVIVGNIGTVYSGNSKREAEKKFASYVESSKLGAGRAGDEPVTLSVDNEITQEYIPAGAESIDGE